MFFRDCFYNKINKDNLGGFLRKNGIKFKGNEIVKNKNNIDNTLVRKIIIKILLNESDLMYNWSNNVSIEEMEFVNNSIEKNKINIINCTKMQKTDDGIMYFNKRGDLRKIIKGSHEYNILSYLIDIAKKYNRFYLI